MENVDIISLLVETKQFIRTMHHVKDDFSLFPQKDHIATCIDYSDVLELREEFVQELVSSVLDFVYSRNKQEELHKRMMDGRSPAAANIRLLQRCRSKFRKSSLRGQFSELLLCNLLQHYFNAVPLLRKMSLTTNPGLERHGADAIHIAKAADTFHLFIGEAKTYNRATGGLKNALHDAIDDVVHKHYPNHRRELDLYIFEDFIDPKLEEIAVAYKENRLKNIQVQLVCLVSYDQKKEVEGLTRDERLASMIATIHEEVKSAEDWSIWKKIPVQIMPKLNYIIFPICEMEDLLASFRKELGLGD